jgi:chromosome partitioning protein
MKKAHCVAISNQKGGVGKTTTAINLSASLAALEHKTLLVDMDPQANATSGVGIFDIPTDTPSVYEALLGQAQTSALIMNTAVPMLDLLPATTDLVGFEVEGLELPERQARLAQALSSVANQYDYIVIDCPPSLSLLTLNALCAADGVLVPLQSEYYALEGLSRLTQTISRIQQVYNPTLQLEAILLTMFDRRNSLSFQVEKEVLTHFPDVVMKTKIPRNVRLSEAPSFGKPIVTYDIRSAGAQSYLACAAEYHTLASKTKQPETVVAPQPLVSTNPEVQP